MNSVVGRGLSIPPAVKDRLLQMFERPRPGHRGSGIGLAITHRAIERLAGTIGVEPTAGGSGSQVWFHLSLG